MTAFPLPRPTRSFRVTLRRSLIRGSLRRQILLAVVLINLALIAVVWALFLYYENERNEKLLEIAREDVDRKVQQFRDVYLGFLRRAVSPAVSVPALIRWSGWLDMRYVKILRWERSKIYINPKGARLLSSEVADEEVELALIETMEAGEERPGPGRGTCIPLEFTPDQPWGAIYLLAAETPPPDIPSLEFLSLFSTLAVGTLLLILVTYVLLNRLVLAPLDVLVKDARRLARGDYATATLALPDRRDEVGRLSLAIDHLRQELAAYKDDMTGRVERALARARASERSLTIAQRLAATGKLAAGIAHEINNPLAGMLNMTRRLREGGLLPEKRDQYLRLIEESLNRIELTLGHLMRSTPRRDIELGPVDLREAVEAAFALVRHRLVRAGIQAEQDLGAGRLMVLADRGSLQQIFLNLFLNACDAMPGGGRLGVAAREHEGEIEIRVQDTGCGMTPEEMDQAFDLFYTTKPVGEGTGLGLGIVHTLVQDLGGEIAVESEPGRGATFYLRFPMEGARGAEP
ncbi:MAG: HAMP domain-containing histidine kinase [Planctomycetes bacterium]|nr:HAMP domain-containing histidine kinase [Planctomycetota bacterium]